MYRVNTSNPGKLADLKEFLGEVEAIRRDLPEPDADDITIIQYKASQFEEVLVDDTSLVVEDANLGTNIRWKIDELSQLIGKRAVFVCYLGIHRKGRIEIFKGEVKGEIVAPRGQSFGFNPHFQPQNSIQTLAESRPKEVNARYYAVQNFLKNQPEKVLEPLFEWTGLFQN